MATTIASGIIIDPVRLHQLFLKYGTEIKAEMISRLMSNAVRGTSYHNPGVATGGLRDSIKWEIIESPPGTLSLQFDMASYGKFVDKGRDAGKQPPMKNIQDWCRIKGIPERFAFPIARNIGRHGIPATNFFTVPIARRREKLLSDIRNLFTDPKVNKRIIDFLTKTS